MPNMNSANATSGLEKNTNSGMDSKNGGTQLPPHKIRHTVVYWLIALVVVVVVWALLYRQINNWIATFGEGPGVVIHISTPATQLALDPPSSTVKVGSTFSVNILLSTGGDKVDGVDIYALHYDPKLLSVVDDDSKTAGVQITPGPVLPVNAYNQVDTKSGSIKFSQIVTPGTSGYQGSGILATVHFKALAAGTADLKFDYTQGATNESNAAYNGREELSHVVDGSYQIEK